MTSPPNGLVNRAATIVIDVSQTFVGAVPVQRMFSSGDWRLSLLARIVSQFFCLGQKHTGPSPLRDACLCHITSTYLVGYIVSNQPQLKTSPCIDVRCNPSQPRVNRAAPM